MTSTIGQLDELAENHRREIDNLRENLQNWISLDDESTVGEMIRSINEHFVAQDEKRRRLVNNSSQTVPSIGMSDATSQTNGTLLNDQESQVDPIRMSIGETQTESLQELLSMVKIAENLIFENFSPFCFQSNDDLFDDFPDNERLLQYIDELSAMPSNELADRLTKDSSQILRKEKLDEDSFGHLSNEQLALAAFRVLYEQHLADDAKQLYNETLIRALKLEYETISKEKNDYLEQYETNRDEFQQQRSAFEKKFDDLQNKYEELLEQNELERLHGEQSITHHAETWKMREKQFEASLLQLNDENRHWRNLYEEIAAKNYDELVEEYQQLRNDFNEAINQNELLKELNAQMYQDKLQKPDAEVERPSEVEAATTNDWNDQFSPFQFPTESSAVARETTDAECQTEEANAEQSTQINNKLKRAFQTIKTKVQQIVADRPELFFDVGDDTIHRLDHLIALVDQQATQIDDLRDRLAQSEDECSSLRQRLDDVDRDALRGEQTNETSNNGDLRALQSIIDQQAEEIRQLSDQLVAQPSESNLEEILSTTKNKIDQIAHEKPDLFDGVGEDMNERLDHLIRIIQNQAAQIGYLRQDRDDWSRR